MVLFQINPNRLTIFPFKCDAPRTINKDAVTFRSAVQRMQTEARQVQVSQYFSLIQSFKPSQTPEMQISPHPPTTSALKQFSQSLVLETPDHRGECNTICYG